MRQFRKDGWADHNEYIICHIHTTENKMISEEIFRLMTGQAQMKSGGQTSEEAWKDKHTRSHARGRTNKQSACRKDIRTELWRFFQTSFQFLSTSRKWFGLENVLHVLMGKDLRCKYKDVRFSKQNISKYIAKTRHLKAKVTKFLYHVHGQWVWKKSRHKAHLMPK